MIRRYRIEEAADGWKVVDRWTGRVAEAGGHRLDGLSYHEAEHTADLLNRAVRPANDP